MSEAILLSALLVVLLTLFCVLSERKLLAFAHRRMGPTLMGRNGSWQIAADLFKMLTKEIFLIPRPTTTLAPIFLSLLFTAQLLFALNFAWGPSLLLVDSVDSMILYHLILILLSNIFFSVVGLLSQSRYAIFGAFSNFLLPTQLVIHNVASTRLGSTAFFFLPSGLISLCQLVCIDGGYQRTNCFSVKELQGILKRKFFTDLVRTGEFTTNTDPTLISTGVINHAPNTPLYNQSLLFNSPLTNTPKYKYSTYNSCLSGGCRPYTQSVTSSIQLNSMLSTLKQVMLIIGLTTYYFSTSGLCVVNECCGCCCWPNNNDHDGLPSVGPYDHDGQIHVNILNNRDKPKTHSPKTTYPSLINSVGISHPPTVEEVKSNPQSSRGHNYDSQQTFRAYDLSVSDNDQSDLSTHFVLYKDKWVKLQRI